MLQDELSCNIKNLILLITQKDEAILVLPPLFTDDSHHLSHEARRPVSQSFPLQSLACPGTITGAIPLQPTETKPGRSKPIPSSPIRCKAQRGIHSLPSVRLSSAGCFLFGASVCYLFLSSPNSCSVVIRMILLWNLVYKRISEMSSLTFFLPDLCRYFCCFSHVRFRL